MILTDIYMSEMKGHRGLPFGILGKIPNTLVFTVCPDFNCPKFVIMSSWARND